MKTDLQRPIDYVRRLATLQLNQERRSELGQFMTPSNIADFMASLFSKWPSKAQLLDPGAGVGSLSEAFAKAFFEHVPNGLLSITAYEIDDVLVKHLSDNFKKLKFQKEKVRKLKTKICAEDFLLTACEYVKNREAIYTHAILNPPYKKINSNSEYKKILKSAGIDASNLYAAFLALSLALTKKDGEVVAIIPRSFCNGSYFRLFREWLFRHAAITRIHLFESRTKAFQEDSVLQENVIIHFKRGATQKSVVISVSKDDSFSDIATQVFDFEKIVNPNDREMFIRIPSIGADLDYPFSADLNDLGLDVSTGPVVDFRVKQYWGGENDRNPIPLLYPHHFIGGHLVWPRKHKKPNAIRLVTATSKLLMPKGWYVVTRRLSSKEEKRRIVAYVVNPKDLAFGHYGFENHLNVIHSRKRGFEPDLAKGLALFLNSSIIDSYFRTFSGHTQVNATDLRSLKFPDRKTLLKFGKSFEGAALPEQRQIDELVSRYARSK